MNALAVSSNVCSGTSMKVMNPYVVTSSPTLIRPWVTRPTPSQTISTRNNPNSSTWIAAISDHIFALRTALARNSCEAERYRSRKSCSPPMPRSTRRPATVSAASSVARPPLARWTSARRSAGPISGTIENARIGTAISTTRPSSGS